MPEPEKPYNVLLNLQVAHALGWTEVLWVEAASRWMGLDPADREPRRPARVPIFIQSWCSTGPLIERFHLAVVAPYETPEKLNKIRTIGWLVCRMGPPLGSCAGPTPLEAVCRWIVASVKDGKVAP